MSRSVLRDGQEAAVIDVGSNSVRMVVYRIDGRAMTPILNEKVMAGLGRDLNRTQMLSPEGVEIAVRAIKRFATLIEALQIREVFPVATAAVREANDGRAFADRIYDETGLKLRILSGDDEARLSALGVSAGAPDAKGIVGDLGGASLELIEISPKGLGRGETFPLGPLTLAREEFDYERVSDQVEKVLTTTKLLGRRGGDFYAVGGAWRALGRIDIALTNHPLGVLHHHQMSRAEVLKVADVVRKQSRRSLEKLEEAAAKRADTLPYAAVVLERVMMAGNFDRVILSAFGLREGVLLERMSEQALSVHPLIAAAEALAGRWSRTRAFGQSLEQWIAPMFVGQVPIFGKKRDEVVRGAAARLADVGGPLHPDQRVEVMFDLILRAPLAAISHEERAFLAAAIHHRYTKAQPRHADAYLRLLNEEQQAAAAALGAALRLGADLSGRSEVLLASFDIAAVDDKLVLRVKKRVAHLVTETASRRLDAAAQALGLTAETKIV
ncbi:Ppx/GppA family phosphatase [Terricaulis silvestris]|uniref:Exopolyphosphatase n=1 Tax=Terricaulis silvestris TaxID=2686094 RepID=A0A6I6MJS0_9CAUL|nr:Ppx/GppA family phosphatase [Terricaulis silvestris]QGZ95440.1 Exopolyphosphatase [Terricaulis silvestris]